jgi:hypothetical protein
VRDSNSSRDEHWHCIYDFSQHKCVFGYNYLSFSSLSQTTSVSTRLLYVAIGFGFRTQSSTGRKTVCTMYSTTSSRWRPIFAPTATAVVLACQCHWSTALSILFAFVIICVFDAAFHIYCNSFGNKSHVPMQTMRSSKLCEHHASVSASAKARSPLDVALVLFAYGHN